MAIDSEGSAYRCESCGEVFKERTDLEEHEEKTHETEGDHDDAAAADTDASGSTSSITEENNDSPSAAEPAEAAGPSGSNGELQTDAGDDEADR